MIVLIDLGNSRVKLGWLDPATGARESAPMALPHRDAPTQLASWLAQLPTPPTEAIGVSVGNPDLTQHIANMLRARGCTLQWQSATSCALGLTNTYARPEQLGADRWAAMLGVLAHLPEQHGPVMLASFGTATTLDTISPERRFVGGLILPGPALMRESLARGTAHLPLAQAHAVPYPSDTHQAIVTGVLAAQAGAVLRQWLAGYAHYNLAPVLYVTGGGWAVVAAEVRRLLDQNACLRGLPACTIHEHDRLVLDGLAALIMSSR